MEPCHIPGIQNFAQHKQNKSFAWSWCKVDLKLCQQGATVMELHLSSRRETNTLKNSDFLQNPHFFNTSVCYIEQINTRRGPRRCSSQQRKVTAAQRQLERQAQRWHVINGFSAHAQNAQPSNVLKRTRFYPTYITFCLLPFGVIQRWRSLMKILRYKAQGQKDYEAAGKWGRT